MKLTTLLFASLFTITMHAQTVDNIQFRHAGYQMEGSIYKPAGNGPFKTIIIVPGSGPNDRRGTLPMQGGYVPCLYPQLLNETLYPYHELAVGLQNKGYAVVTYDKFEYTHHNSHADSFTFERVWLPAQSLIQHLKTRPDIKSHELILIGHSEGSYIIPYLAQQDPAIQYLISIAGAAQPFDTLLATQLVNFARQCQGDTATAHLQAQQILAYFNMVRTNHQSVNVPFAGIKPTDWYAYTQAFDKPGLSYLNAQRRTLVIGLDKDFNVPIQTQFDVLQQQIGMQAQYLRFPNLIHYMTSDQDPHVSQALIDSVHSWLQQSNYIQSNDKSYQPPIKSYWQEQNLHILLDESLNNGQGRLYTLSGACIYQLTNSNTSEICLSNQTPQPLVFVYENTNAVYRYLIPSL